MVNDIVDVVVDVGSASCDCQAAAGMTCVIAT